MIKKATGWLLSLATLAILTARVAAPQSTQSSKTPESSTLNSVSSTAPFQCPVTPYSQQKPPDSHTASFTETWYGNDALWAGLAPVYQGDWYAGLNGVKVLWYRSGNGQLTVEGKRLDAEAPKLKADIPEGYGNSGYQASGLIFSSEGCWEVTGQVGDQTLHFVVDVHPASENPTK
jgi:hypothetical protein